MNYMLLLTKASDFTAQCGQAGLANTIIIIKTVLKWICIIIPIILIVMCVVDLAKIVTAGDKTDDVKKKAISTISTRVIFAIVIFLVPTLVNALFGIFGDSFNQKDGSASFSSCWAAVKNTTKVDLGF